MTLQREHWEIVTLTDRTRDMLLDEYASLVQCDRIPQVISALLNVVISMLRISEYNDTAYALRYFAAHSEQAFKLIGISIDN